MCAASDRTRLGGGLCQECTPLASNGVVTPLGFHRNSLRCLLPLPYRPDRLEPRSSQPREQHFSLQGALLLLLLLQEGARPSPPDGDDHYKDDGTTTTTTIR